MLFIKTQSAKFDNSFVSIVGHEIYVNYIQILNREEKQLVMQFYLYFMKYIVCSRELDTL